METMYFYLSDEENNGAVNAIIKATSFEELKQGVRKALADNLDADEIDFDAQFTSEQWHHITGWNIHYFTVDVDIDDELENYQLQITRTDVLYDPTPPDEFDPTTHGTTKLGSLVLEFADDIAEALTAGDMPDDEMYNEDKQGHTLTEEAQEIFNTYYDEWTDNVSKFLNAAMKIQAEQK